MSTLLKRSPLSGIYRRRKAKLGVWQGWQVAEDFGNASGEQSAAKDAVACADWSAMGKALIRGKGACEQAETMYSGAKDMPVLSSLVQSDKAICRLVDDEYLVLYTKGSLEKELESSRDEVLILDQSGALGALALVGPKRQEILERSSAMNLEPHTFTPGQVVQTTVHTIHCTILRRESYDLLVHSRDFSVSLFEALEDVGKALGFQAAGRTGFPINFDEKA